MYQRNKAKRGNGLNIFNLSPRIEQITRRMTNNSTHHIMDGPNDDYPQTVINEVAKSPNATLCLQRRISYVCGKELVGGDLILDDDGTTLSDIHPNIVEDFETLDRVCIEILQPQIGNDPIIKYIDVEKFRYMPPRDGEDSLEWVYYDPKRGTRESSKPDELLYYRVYKNPEHYQRTKGEDYSSKKPYHGHVIFFNELSNINRVYSRPKFMAAENWIRTDGRIGEYWDSLSANGFFVGGVVVFRGDPDEPVIDPDTGDVLGYRGDMVADYMDSALTGTENAGSIMSMWDKTPDGTGSPMVTSIPWPGNPDPGQFRELFPLCREVISTQFEVPEVLLPISTPGKLGQTQEIINAQLMFNSATAPRRERLIKGVYSKIAELKGGNRDISITPILADLGIPYAIYYQLPAGAQAEYIRSKYGIEVEGENLKPLEDAEPNQTNNEDRAKNLGGNI